MKILIAKLRDYLKANNISINKFANKMGIDKETLNSILTTEQKLGYQISKKLVYALGANEANKIIDWEGMKIAKPII